MTCLLNKEIDFFIVEQISAQFLREDTVELHDKIFKLKDIINDQDESLRAYNKIGSDQGRIINSCLQDYTKMKQNYEKSEKKCDRRKTVIFSLSGIILLLGAILAFK